MSCHQLQIWKLFSRKNVKYYVSFIPFKRCNWLKSIARKNFKPSKYSKLCSLHFKTDNFIEVSHDSNK